MAIVTINGSDVVSASRTTINNNFSYLDGKSGTRAGITSAISVTASPFTYTAGLATEYVYIGGGSITSVARNGTALPLFFPLTVILDPGAAVVVTYDSGDPPTMVTDK
jgi:hypothetical protein